MAPKAVAILCQGPTTRNPYGKRDEDLVNRPAILVCAVNQHGQKVGPLCKTWRGKSCARTLAREWARQHGVPIVWKVRES